MKTLRRISAVTILCLTLAVSVLAGQTDTPGAPAPAPKPKSSTTQPTGPAASILLMVLDLIYR